MTSDRSRPRRARLADVAQAAGVSLGAASKALSAPDTVRPRTLATVRAAVERLGYVPSGAGRMLASRSTRMVGVVLPSLYHPIYATYFHELQKLLAREDYLAVAMSHEFDKAVEQELISRLVSKGVDALVLIGARHDAATMAMIRRVGLPHVFAWAADEAAPPGAVGFSDRDGMVAIVRHLAGLGHRRIAMLNGDPRDNERAAWREQGVRDAARAHGIELAEVAVCPLTVDGGRDGFHRIAPVARGVTALICSTDLLAAGAIDAARKDGIAVPDTLSVTGFDDIEMAELLTPGLTTVRVPVLELARLSVERVTAVLKGSEPVEAAVLPVSLVVRGSTGPAPR
ncbi:MAG: substrate-binding domain-containing protein [Novosphingobium sp.]|nr:substrate-binding domain-containing protein [Novosphingobium sp.]